MLGYVTQSSVVGGGRWNGTEGRGYMMDGPGSHQNTPNWLSHSRPITINLVSWTYLIK